MLVQAGTLHGQLRSQDVVCAAARPQSRATRRDHPKPQWGAEACLRELGAGVACRCVNWRGSRIRYRQAYADETEGAFGRTLASTCL